MKKIKTWLCAGLFALGCRSPAERVLADYASEPKCMDRLRYTLYPEADRAAFEREYPTGTCKTGKPNIDTTSCDSAKVGETCFVTMSSSTGCLKRTSEDEFKIDWQCSTGYNEIPVKTFASGSQNEGAVVFRLSVELGDYYNWGYSYKKASHQSLRMQDHRNETLDGFVERISEAGQRLLELLSDGKKHDLTLAVANLDRSKSSNVEVLDIVQEDWRSLPAASVEVAKKRASDRLSDLNALDGFRERERALQEFGASLR